MAKKKESRKIVFCNNCLQIYTKRPYTQLYNNALLPIAPISFKEEECRIFEMSKELDICIDNIKVPKSFKELRNVNYILEDYAINHPTKRRKKKNPKYYTKKQIKKNLEKLNKDESIMRLRYGYNTQEVAKDLGLRQIRFDCTIEMNQHILIQIYFVKGGRRYALTKWS